MIGYTYPLEKVLLIELIKTSYVYLWCVCMKTFKFYFLRKLQFTL